MKSIYVCQLISSSSVNPVSPQSSSIVSRLNCSPFDIGCFDDFVPILGCLTNNALVVLMLNMSYESFNRTERT